MDRAIDVPATSYHAGLLELPAQEAEPHGAIRLSVRAIFSRAIHLQTADGWIVSLTTLPYNGPLGVRLDRPSLHGLGIKPGMQGSLRDGQIVIGHVRVSLERAIAWDPYSPTTKPSTEALAYRKGRRGLGEGHTARPAVPADARTRRRSSGLEPVKRLTINTVAMTETLRLQTPSCLLREMGLEGEGFFTRITALGQSLMTVDHAGIRRHALALLGLGPGLTPSGDDVLVGLLAGLYVLGHRAPGTPALDTLPVIARAVMEAAPSRTTTLSRTLLRYSACGVAVEPLLDVLWNLGPEANVEALWQLQSIGHTSGHDMLAGAMVAADTVARWEEMGGATLGRPA